MKKKPEDILSLVDVGDRWLLSANKTTLSTECSDPQTAPVRVILHGELWFRNSWNEDVQRVYYRKPGDSLLCP